MDKCPHESWHKNLKDEKNWQCTWGMSSTNNPTDQEKEAYLDGYKTTWTGNDTYMNYMWLNKISKE